jgi:hypothetical protein
MTLETAMQNGELMKRYKQPDTDILETYQQPAVEELKLKKLQLDLPMIQARIKQIQAKTAAIPQEIDIKYKNLLNKIKNDGIKNNLRAAAIDVSREANGIRLWGLQNTHQRGMMGLGIRQAQFGLNVDKMSQQDQHFWLKRLDSLGAKLDARIGASAKAVVAGQPQVQKAMDAMAQSLKTQIENARAYVLNMGDETYNDAFIDNELATGGLQRPSRMLGGQYGGMSLPNPGDVSYQYGGYPGLTPDAMATYMSRGAGMGTGQPAPLYMPGGAGVNPGNYVQQPVPSPQTRQVKMSPDGFGVIGGPKNSFNPLPIKASDKSPHNRLSGYTAREDKKTKP